MARALTGAAITAWRPDPRSLRRVVEGVLLVLLATQAARLAWAVVTPLGPIGAPAATARAVAYSPPADLSALERFAAAPVAPTLLPAPGLVSPEAAPPPITGYSLHGVRGAIFGDRGSAIIAGPNGQQASYRVGERVGPGVTLAGVGRDAATLSGPGGSVRLEVGVPTSPPAAPAATNPLPISPAGPGLVLPPSTTLKAPDPMAGALLTPRRENGRFAGLTVQAEGGTQASQQTSLQPGDMLLAVNGRALDSTERQSAFAAELSRAGGAEIRYERNGRMTTTRRRATR